MNQNYLKKMTRTAILIAVSIGLVYFIHFPIFPQVPFLEYDPADISILMVGFAYGPISGILVTIIASIIQGLTVSAQSGLYGILMHIIATSALCGISSLYYKNHKDKKGALIGLTLGCIAMVIVMIIANILITPYFMGVSIDAVISLMPFIILFNLIKAILNSIVTFLLYKRISPILHN